MTSISGKAWRENLAVLALFGLLTLVMTWPVAGRLGSELAGGRDDLWVHQWTFWWVRDALRSGVSPFFTPNLYFPQGVDLTSHNIAWFNIAAWLPLQALFGRTVAYNLVFLIVITLNGFCTYLFARSEIGRLAPAFTAGFIVGFWPYTLSHYDHANMMVLFWVPLTLLLIRRLIGATAESERSRLRWGLILSTAVSLAMIGITRWQMLIMSSPVLIGYTIFLLIQTRQRPSGELVASLLLVGGLAALLMAPLAAPLVIDQLTRDFPDDVFLDEAVWGRTDLLAYLIPSINNRLWGPYVEQLYENFVVNQFYTPYLSYTALALAAAGLLRRWRQTWIWFLLALLFMILALGPELAVNGRSFPSIPMPYRAVEDWFLFRLIRRPDRLNVVLSLPLAMMAGWGVEWLVQRLPTIATRRIAVTGIIGLLFLAYLPIPFATTPLVLPRWYASQAAAGELGPVVELPINDRSYDKWYMAYQTEHEQPIATGHVSRLPREATAFLDTVPLLADLQARDQLPDAELTAVSDQLRLLADASIPYLVIHKQFANEGLQAAWRDWLAFEPWHEDEELLVYRTAPQFQTDFVWQHRLNDSMGLVRAQSTPDEAVQGGVIAANLVWGTASAPPADYEVCLQLQNESNQATACQPPDSEAATSTWPANDIRRGTVEIDLPYDLPPGEYNLTLFLTDDDNTNGETVPLGPVMLHPFAAAAAEAVLWQNGIQLRGHELAQLEDALQVTLFWQAAERLPTSYKVFVHLVDPADGRIVAQSDSIPRTWQYPTDQWRAGEIVRDVITLPLEGIESGTYDLRAGLYDERSGERVLLANSNMDNMDLGRWTIE